MSSCSLIALPGFLGLKEDWQNFSATCFGVQNFIAMDLFQAPNLKIFAKHFNDTIKVQAPRVIMGYSLGARLAMHVVLDNSSLWHKAIFISGHPGLSNLEEKAQRCQQDALWADSFKNDSWEELMEKWNSQPVFKQTHSFSRKEEQFSRSEIAHCLTHYSLGRQDDLRKKIAALNLPILWLTGSADEKFTNFSESISLKHPKSKKMALPGSHRLPWDNEQGFKKEVYCFLQEV